MVKHYTVILEDDLRPAEVIEWVINRKNDQ